MLRYNQTFIFADNTNIFFKLETLHNFQGTYNSTLDINIKKTESRLLYT